MPTANPIQVRAIDHVVLRAADHRTLIAFYRDVLNCPVEREVHDLGLYQLRAGTSLIDIVDAHGALGRKAGRPPDHAAPTMDHLCIQVEPWDADAIAAHLRAHGIEPGEVVSRYGAKGDGPSLYITDPEGNGVELKGPPQRS